MTVLCLCNCFSYILDFIQSTCLHVSVVLFDYFTWMYTLKTELELCIPSKFVRSEFLPSYVSTAQIGPCPLYWGFLITHIQTQDFSIRVISPSKRPLPTQDNTYINKRQTSMPSAGLEPATPATKLLQTYALDRAATGIDKI
jgi:hypothetical protein